MKKLLLCWATLLLLWIGLVVVAPAAYAGEIALGESEVTVKIHCNDRVEEDEEGRVNRGVGETPKERVVACVILGLDDLSSLSVFEDPTRNIYVIYTDDWDDLDKVEEDIDGIVGTVKDCVSRYGEGEVKYGLGGWWVNYQIDFRGGILIN